jgi:hypothetical protein
MGLSDEEIDRVLEHRSPDVGYQPWLHTGMALHHETGGSDEGMQKWNEWSSTGSTSR